MDSTIQHYIPNLSTNQTNTSQIQLHNKYSLTPTNVYLSIVFSSCLTAVKRCCGVPGGLGLFPRRLGCLLRDTDRGGERQHYSALRKYSAPLNFATFCHISGFKHKDIKLYFFVKNQQQVGHNH